MLCHDRPDHKRATVGVARTVKGYMSHGEMTVGEGDQATIRGSRFEATHWSVILDAQKDDSPRASAALEKLCRTYWYPVYCYIRHRGFSVAEAEDAAQGFFAMLLEGKSFLRVEPQKGKFRSFLIAALNHFLTNEWKKAHALKRGGGAVLVSLDDTAEMRYTQEPALQLTPETLYDRSCALAIFGRALSIIRGRYVQAGKRELYEVLKGFLSDEPADGDYERVGESLGLSRNCVAAAVFRLRQHYREQVRAEVLQTVSSSAEVEHEIQSLLAALSQ